MVIYLLYSRESSFKKENILGDLSSYSSIIQKYIKKDSSIKNVDFNEIEELLPKDLRTTIIYKDGKVIYDNSVSIFKDMENHLMRPEIQNSLIKGNSNTIRYSNTNKIYYLYQAIDYGDYFIRLALPYNVNLKLMLRAENLYIYIILIIFIISIFILSLLSIRLSLPLSKLKKLALDPGEDIHFNQKEFSEIGKYLKSNYTEILKTQEKYNIERDRLIKHFSHLKSGVAFFSPELKTIYSNVIFNSYLNKITSVNSLRAAELWTSPEFKKCLSTLKEGLKNNKLETTYNEIIIAENASFLVKAFIFEDKYIEISIDDVTTQEDNKKLKLEITSNIAHELRMPISTISGYLETLIINKDIDKAQTEYFIQKAYSQTQRLSSLIEDISLISKIENKDNNLEKEEIHINDIMSEIKQELSDKIIEKDASIIDKIAPSMCIHGNYNLVYAIFRNLIDNALNYSGAKPYICIENDLSDNDFEYFTIWDKGKGVPKEALNKIFERFYRPNEGRTRKDGGSGLGLSIVRNAIMYHNGTISAKNRATGGLEINFALPKRK